MTGSTGQQVGAAAQRVPAPSTTLTLAPGQRATAILGVVNAGNLGSGCQIAAVQGLRVYPPGDTAPLFVPHTDEGCANPSDATLTIRPVAAA
jgi:hypothetical protein